MSLHQHTILLIIYGLIFETQHVDGCNYYYQKIPTTAPNTTCNLMEGGSAVFNCDAIGTCNTFTLLWIKHTNEGSFAMNSSEHISHSDWSSDKYHILTSAPQPVANGYCNIGSALTIHEFNYSDNGYYSCQIVLNNSCPLQPSPSVYAAVEDTSEMSEIGCISESTSLNSIVKITPTTMIDPYSTHTRTYNISSITTTTSMVTLHGNNREENMVWVYGLVTALLLVTIVLILSLVIVSVKLRTHQKPTSVSHRNKFSLAQEEVPNPHYTKVTLADSNADEEEPSILNNTQFQTDQNGGQVATTSTGDIHNFAIYNQGKVIDYSDESPKYTAVNRAKQSLRAENSEQTTTGDEWFSPGYAEIGDHEIASKTVLMTEELENPSPYLEPQKRSASPVYAEVHKDRKRNKQQEDRSAVVEEKEKSQSPEYSQVEKVNKHSKDTVNKEKHEDEQHYYYSLENPEEHGCSGNNNVIEETVYKSEHSLEFKVVQTQSMLYETPGPGATNTHTEIADSEVNTLPNPCYHTHI